MARVEIIQKQQTPRPRAHIVANTQNESPASQASKIFHGQARRTLEKFIAAKGDISHLLSETILSEVGMRACEEYGEDLGSISGWRRQAEHALTIVAQDADKVPPTWPFEGASAVNYPLIQTASYQWGARAYPELIRGEAVVGIKAWSQPTKKPSNVEVQTLQNLIQAPQQPDPSTIQKMSPQEQQKLQQYFQDSQAHQQYLMQQAQLADAREEAISDMKCEAKNARAYRVAEYLNWCIFNKMDNWESDTDALLNNLPILGSAFKKVYMGPQNLCSEFVSAMNLTVPSNTKSFESASRITHDYEMLPVHIEQAMRSDRFRQVELAIPDEDMQEPRKIIEQLRYEDLDGDGLAEPYLVTVDEESQTTLRIEPAYTEDDIKVNGRSGQVIRVECYCPYAAFEFLPDPRGNFYATGFAKILDNISQSIDSLINQTIDAGTAQIAGGGLIGSNVRLQQDGALYVQAGEYRVVNVDGGTLRENIFERTLPNPSEVSLEMLKMLIESAKEIASIKDVMSGEGNQMAAVGTTLAMQDQALKVFSSIYKRVYRGFKTEFRLMFDCMKRFATDRQRREYQELTGGDLDEDFGMDSTSIQPVADPQAVSMMMKIARNQALAQLAESPVGQAAGMNSPEVSQLIAKEFMTDLGIDRPERFIGPVQGNQAEAAQEQAKAADLQASAQLKVAQTKKTIATIPVEAARADHEQALAVEDIAQARAETAHTHIKSLAEIAKIHHAAAALGDPVPTEPTNVGGQ